MEYIKINSLWKRAEFVKGAPKGSHGALLEGQYAEPEFGNIKRWEVEEKIDGTNVRIYYRGGKVSFGGRTDAAELQPHLLEYLQKTFTEEKLASVFASENPEKDADVILYGEGYGPKIQAAGGNYRKDVAFMLFDIRVGAWWLKREDVREGAEKLGVTTPPVLGLMTEEEIIEFVKSRPLSRCSYIPQMMEGIVARSEPLVLFRNGRPILWKLKCKEFV